MLNRAVPAGDFTPMTTVVVREAAALGRPVAVSGSSEPVLRSSPLVRARTTLHAAQAAEAGRQAGLLDEGVVFNGRYRVVRRLGAGGMAVVYEVLQLATQRRRALKVLLPTLDRELAACFEREATVASSIESRHIAEVVDAGTDEETGLSFLVMELLRGEDLAAMLERRARLPPREVVGYLWQAARALDRAHAANIVHRDLKPANLFVTRADDGSTLVKLLDFGVAKVLNDAAAADTRGVIGTPLYIAPEQAHHEQPLSPATDVHAIGQLAYALLVGEPYWAAEQEATDNVMQLLLKLASGARHRPSARARERCGVELPRAFDAWFGRAAAPLPERRFATASEAVRALAAVYDLDPADCLASTRHDVPHDAAQGRRDVSTSPVVTRPGRAASALQHLLWPMAVTLLVAALGMAAWRARTPPAEVLPIAADAEVASAPPAIESAASAMPPTAAAPSDAPPQQVRHVKSGGAPPPAALPSVASAAPAAPSARAWEPPVLER